MRNPIFCYYCYKNTKYGKTKTQKHLILYDLVGFAIVALFACCSFWFENDFVIIICRLFLRCLINFFLENLDDCERDGWIKRRHEEENSGADSCRRFHSTSNFNVLLFLFCF